MNEQYVDSLWERCLAVFFPFVIILLDVFKVNRLSLSQKLFDISVFMVLMHHYWLTVRNDFNLYYIAGAILSITALTIILNSII